MKLDTLDDVRIVEEQILISPEELKTRLPLTGQHRHLILNARQTIKDIINKKDSRMLIVCGPCSIHDPKAAIEYAKKLKALSEQVNEQLFLVMRVHFEKPQATTSWKGLINDPHRDNTFNTEQGLSIARQLLIELTDIGIPLAFEALDPNIPQYLGDLFSWVAIGERATELPMHRDMASGLSMPVGFKNGADGHLDTAIKAMKSSAKPRCFVGINQQGQVSLLKTSGNSDTHVILREGDIKDCRANNIEKCEHKMEKAELDKRIMIDCSHGNTNKDFRHQLAVAQSVIEQIERGNSSIIGIMLKSFIHEGNQSCELKPEEMRFGVSITDACINWQDTETMLNNMAHKLADVLTKRQIVQCFAPINWN